MTVQAVTGATGAEMDKMREQAKELGRSTRFSASEAGEGMEMLARAGFDTSEVMDALPSVLDLAAAGAVELGDAADITSNILSGFGMEAEETARVADILAQASADSNVDVQGLGEAFKYAGPIASDLGVSIEDTAASIGVLGDAGIQGGQAGRQLRKGLQSLAAPTSEASSLMNDLGIEVFDAEGNMKSMPEVIGQLENGLDGMSSQQKSATLETLFGADAMSAWSVLVNEGADELGNFSSELANSEGTAGEMADVMEDNLAGSMRSLKSALEGVAISFSELGEGPIRSMIDWLTDMVRKFDNLSDKSKQWIVIFASIAAAIGPILLVIGTLVSWIPKVVAGFKMIGLVLGALTGPISLTIAIVTLLVAAIVLAYKKSETFREVVSTAFNFVKDIIMTVVDAVVGFVMEIWGFMVDWWAENNELIRETANTIWTSIQEKIELVMMFLVPFLQGAWEAISLIVQVVWEYIKTMVMIAMEFIGGIITAIMHVINGNWDEAWEAIKQIFINVWERMEEFTENVTEIIKNAVKDKFEQAKEIIRSRLEDAKKYLIDKFNEMKQNAINKAQEILTNIRNKFNEIKTNITNKLQEAKTALVNRFTEMVTNAINKAQEIVTTVKDKFEEVKNGIRDKLTDAVTVVGEKIGEMPGKVMEFFTDMVDSGKQLIAGIISGIKQMGSQAIDAVTGVVDGAINKAKDLLKISSPSRVFREFGEYTGEGLAIGIDKTGRMVEKASQAMTDRAIPDMNKMDIGSRINTINSRAERDLNHTFQSNMSVEKQPATINVFVGSKQVASEIVDDITEMQERNTFVRESFA